MQGRGRVAQRLVASDDPCPRSRCGERRICRGAAVSRLRAFEGVVIQENLGVVVIFWEK
jgi:hypothetical protein